VSCLSGGSASAARRLGVVTVVPRPCLHYLENPGGCLGPSGQREGSSSSPGDCGHIGARLGVEGQVTSPATLLSSGTPHLRVTLPEAHASIHSFSALNLIHKQPPPFPYPSPHSFDVILPPPVSILRHQKRM
uniref:Uncharacterized protein n=1 Tax=Colobus angolensis palliatus TaxID=336983 RepID=A0A2K5KEE7_COLAP